jgi:hypothetical protein
MVNIHDWHASFQQALDEKREWLSSTGISELQTDFSDFRTTYATLYSMLLQKRVVMQDPYKSETSVNDLYMPETSPLFEPKKREAFSMRLAKYDNQLEYVATFCPFSIDVVKPDKIRILQAIIWFIEWKNLSLTSPSPNTQAMAEIFINLRKNTVSSMAMKNFEACVDVLYSVASHIDELLNDFSIYHQEAYKGAIRSSITADANGVMTLDDIKGRFFDVFPGKTFSAGLVEELIREDYSPNAQTAQKSVLDKLAVKERESHVVQEVHSAKSLLVEGLETLGSTSDTFHEIIAKIGHNHGVYRHKRKSLVEMIRVCFAILFNRKLTTDFYMCEITGSVDARIEKIDHYVFVEQLSRKMKELKMFATGGGGMAKWEKMNESELLESLTQNIHDLQYYHRLLTALDEFFRTQVEIDHRSRIKGMRPELSTIKNALSKAIVKQEYYLVTQHIAK